MNNLVLHYLGASQVVPKTKNGSCGRYDAGEVIHKIHISPGYAMAQEKEQVNKHHMYP